MLLLKEDDMVMVFEDQLKFCVVTVELLRVTRTKISSFCLLIFFFFFFFSGKRTDRYSSRSGHHSSLCSSHQGDRRIEERKDVWPFFHNDESI